MHQIGLKTIFKEPIFTAVEGKSLVCDSTNISVHVDLSEHATETSGAATAMLKVFNLAIVENIPLHFIFHKIPHLLN